MQLATCNKFSKSISDRNVPTPHNKSQLLERPDNLPTTTNSYRHQRLGPMSSRTLKVPVTPTMWPKSTHHSDPRKSFLLHWALNYAVERGEYTSYPALLASVNNDPKKAFKLLRKNAGVKCGDDPLAREIVLEVCDKKRAKMLTRTLGLVGEYNWTTEVWGRLAVEWGGLYRLIWELRKREIAEEGKELERAKRRKEWWEAEKIYLDAPY